ncbi:MAG TPA: four helix bundle protein [Pyrinomonadaceae bacterium]|nr:four helix bundle protein [Pyrinomonadaceae bacterium]
MATFKTFEQIDAWQKSRELTNRVYILTSRGSFARDYGLRDQIRRASVSIMSNIAEGFERSGTKEFTQFLATAKGSAGEVRSQLYVALDQNYLDQDEFNILSSTATEISRMISGLMAYLRGSGMSGTKFKTGS